MHSAVQKLILALVVVQLSAPVRAQRTPPPVIRPPSAPPGALLTPWPDLVVPEPRDLCGHPRERIIRKRVKAAREPGSAGAAVVPSPSRALVPCEHGRLVVFQFVLRQQRVLVVVEKDNRPSYLSGGAHYRCLALVDSALVYGIDAVWQQLKRKDKLQTRDIVNLQVAALMFGSQPNMIVNLSQCQTAVGAWPEAAPALALDPPGLYRRSDGTPVLQAWTIHSYSERGVACKYLQGWRYGYRAASGVSVEQRHAYAQGMNMGQPCGAPLPGAPKTAPASR